MNLVPSVSHSVDRSLVQLAAVRPGPLVPPPSQHDATVPASEPAFLATLAVLVAQVEHGPDPVRPALELSRLTVTRMAEELGIPRATLAAYRLGTRRMPAANRARLGAYLARHAEALARVAQALSARSGNGTNQSI
jgi:hypothetical protein